MLLGIEANVTFAINHELLSKSNNMHLNLGSIIWYGYNPPRIKCSIGYSKHGAQGITNTGKQYTGFSLFFFSSRNFQRITP